MATVAIIPARGGSKRIQLKNIRIFYGKPILTRTIETLQSSELFDRIIVSTDSTEIAELVHGLPSVEVSRRNPQLASDDTNVIDVMAAEIEISGIQLQDVVCCVYAPNPFLHQGALTLGLTSLLEKKEADYVSAVTSFPFPIQRSLKMQENGLLTMENPDNLLVHSQDLERRFHETAQFWWAKAITWADRKPMQHNMLGIYTPRWMTQDIDSLEDWKQAEIRWKVLLELGIFETYVFSESNILTANLNE